MLQLPGMPSTLVKIRGHPSSKCLTERYLSINSLQPCKKAKSKLANDEDVWMKTKPLGQLQIYSSASKTSNDVLLLYKLIAYITVYV